jgi:hypothetical protein
MTQSGDAMVDARQSQPVDVPGDLMSSPIIEASKQGDLIAFKTRHPCLVWSNSRASDAVWIRAALLRPRFNTILDACLEFGLTRVCQEWELLLRDNAPEALPVAHESNRILKHIEEGFADAQSGY